MVLYSNTRLKMSGIDGVAIGAVLAGTGALVGGFGSLINNEKYVKPIPNVPWYDIINSYTDFTEEYTNTIDQILINTCNSKIQYKLVLPGNRVVPNIGFHEWYDCRTSNTLTLSKNNYADKGELPKYYYTLIYTDMWIYSKKDIAKYFIDNIIFKEDNGRVNVIRFENTDGNCKPIIVHTLYRSPLPNQQKAIEIINKQYNDSNNFNVKTILCGKSGIGKTYTSVLLKRYLESKMINTNVQLFENFDPSIPGYDINKHVLQYATEQSPVILVINEIDKLYHEVHEKMPLGDPRTPHTKNKISFNNMLDNIANTKYVITIFTTEKSPEELQNEKINYPFYRQGRIDFFIEVDKLTSTQVLHKSES